MSKEHQSDFPEGMSAPSLRALHNAGIKDMRALAGWSEEEVAAMHGMGPKGVRTLKEAMRGRKIAFKSRKTPAK